MGKFLMTPAHEEMRCPLDESIKRSLHSQGTNQQPNIMGTCAGSDSQPPSFREGIDAKAVKHPM